MINDDHKQDEMASKVMQESPTVSGNGSISDSDTGYDTAVNDADHVPVESRSSDIILRPNDGDNNKEDLVESGASEEDNTTDSPSKSSDETRKCSVSKSSQGDPSTRPESPSLQNRRRVSDITLPANDGGKSSDGTRKCSVSRSSRGNPSTRPTSSSVRNRRRVSDIILSVNDDDNAKGGLVEPKGSGRGDPMDIPSESDGTRKFSVTRATRSSRGNPSTSRPTKSPSVRNRRRVSDTILTANDGDNANEDSVESKASEGDNSMDGPSKSSDEMRRWCPVSKSSRGNPSIKPKSPSVRNRRRISEIVLPAYDDDNANRDLVESIASEGNNTMDGALKCPVSRSSRRNSSMRPKKSPTSVRNRRCVMSSIAVANIMDTFPIMDGLDDPSTDPSSPTKSGEELLAFASSSDATKEKRPDHRPEEVKPRRRAFSCGPRDRLSKSGHSRSRGSRGERLSQSSHAMTPRIRRDRLSQSSRANLKAPAPAEDDTIDDSADNEYSGPEENTPQEKSVLRSIRRNPYIRPKSPSVRNSRRFINSVAVANTMDTFSMPGLDGLDDPIGDACCTTESGEERVTFVSSSDATKERTPGHRPEEVHSRRRASSCGPRGRVSKSSHSRSKGSRGERSSHSRQTETSRIRRDRICQSSHANLKAPAPAQDDTIDDSAENEFSTSSEKNATQEKTEDDAGLVMQKKSGKWKNKIADLLATPKRVTRTFTLMDVPSFSPLAICTISPPFESDCQKTPAKSGKSTAKSNKKVVNTFAPSLDPPSGCVHPVPQTKSVMQIKPGKWKNKIVDLLATPKRVTRTLTLKNAPSLANSVSYIPPPFESECQKIQAKFGKSTDLSEVLSSKEAVKTFMLDAPSLADPPSVSFLANLNTQENEKLNGLQDGHMSGANANFVASADISKQSDRRRAVSWVELSLDGSSESKKD